MLTQREVYNKLRDYMYLIQGDIRQSNIFAVKHTWYYFNNKLKLYDLIKSIGKDL